MTRANSSRRVGQTGVTLGAVGYGTWQWGDVKYWGYGSEYTHEDVAAAFRAALGAERTMFDSAEIYGGGASERILGALAREQRESSFVVSKYMPFPTRLRTSSLDEAIDRSLRRLQLERIDLYLIHWPLSLVSHSRLAAALARAVRDGRIGYVGVSNFSAGAMRRMHARLADLGVPLVANQVQYSLVRRAPEVNGVLEACGELGVTLVAYSPLGQGVLSGKYDLSHPPARLRRWSRRFRDGAIRQAAPVLAALREIAAAHDSTPSQVAIAWLLRDERVLPIPGVKTAAQVREIAAARDLELDDSESRRLDAASAVYRHAPAIARLLVG